MDFDRVTTNVIQQANGCWIWQKSLGKSSYGQITEDGRYWGAHVYAYVCQNGPVPPGSKERLNSSLV